MKKTLIVVVMILALIGLTGCANVSEYEALDHNIYWVKGECVIKETIFPTCSYYKIDEIPINKMIARRSRSGMIGDVSHPAVLIHQDAVESLELDITTAKLVLANTYWSIPEKEWINLGECMTKSVVVNIESELAQKIADDIRTSELHYVDLYEEYDDWTGGTLPYIKKNGEVGDMALQFTLADYDNLIWMAHSVVVQGDYYIQTLHFPEDGERYIRCNEEFSTFLQEVIEEYGLSVAN